jgi:hypothetical protein
MIIKLVLMNWLLSSASVIHYHFNVGFINNVKPHKVFGLFGKEHPQSDFFHRSSIDSFVA